MKKIIEKLTKLIDECDGGAISTPASSAVATTGLASLGTAPTPPISQITVNGQPWTAGKNYPARKKNKKSKYKENRLDPDVELQIEDFDDDFIYGVDITPSDIPDVFSVDFVARNDKLPAGIVPVYVAHGSIQEEGWNMYPVILDSILNLQDKDVSNDIFHKWVQFKKSSNFDTLTDLILDKIKEQANKLEENTTIRSEVDLEQPVTMKYYGITPNGKEYKGTVDLFPTAFGWQYTCTDPKLEAKNPEWTTIDSKQKMIYWFRNELYALGCKHIEVGDESWDIPDDQLVKVDETFEKETEYISINNIDEDAWKILNSYLVNYGDHLENEVTIDHQDLVDFIQEVPKLIKALDLIENALGSTYNDLLDGKIKYVTIRYNKE